MGLSSGFGICLSNGARGTNAKSPGAPETIVGPAAPAKASRLDSASGYTARSDETDASTFPSGRLDLAQTDVFIDAAP